MRIRGRPSGPVVLLGAADSLFVALMARWLRDRGRTVRVISLQRPGPALPADVDVIDARPRSWPARIGFRAIRPLVHTIQRRWMERRVEHFRRVTGKDRPDEWEWAVWDQLEHAWRLSRLALHQRPRCVIGQELAGYGAPAALCRGVPRILHPWGSDVYLTPESWPGAECVIRFAVRRSELLIPSSATAAEHLVRRFGVDPARVLGLSQGVDPQCVRTTDPAARARICGQWGIAPSSVIVQNCRRFRRQWGSDAVLNAFLKIARDRAMTQFVLLGGAADVPEITSARERITAAGLNGRFTIIDRALSAAEYQELARVSDVSVSLVQRGDMRSASVLIHAAAGASQVVAEHPEFRSMEQDGFRATFVDPDQPQHVADAVRRYVDDPARRATEAEANQRYILEHEHQPRQVGRILDRIDAVCDEFYARSLPP